MNSRAHTLLGLIASLVVSIGIEQAYQARAAGGIDSYSGTFEYVQEYAGSDQDGTKLEPYTKAIKGTVAFFKTAVNRPGRDGVSYQKV
jgi:hypothetical protein